MTQRVYRGVLFLVIAAALAASFWTAGHRMQAEQEFRRVNTAVNYDEVVMLAGLTGRDPAAALEELREHGVTAVLFREHTVKQAGEGGAFTILSAGELRAQPWFPEAGPELRPECRYLVTRDERMYAHLRREMQLKVGDLETLILPEGHRVIALPVPDAYLDTIGVGFPPPGPEQAAAAGLNVIPQVRSWPGVTPKGLTNLAANLGKMPNLSAVAFNDSSVPGFPGLVHVLARELTALEVPVTSIEFFDQAGVTGLGRNLPARQVMLHAIRVEEMPNYTPARAADRLLLAAEERNARVLLVRFFFDPQGAEDLWTVNTAYLDDIAQRLEAAGLVPGAPVAPAPWQPPRGVVALIGLGVIAGGLLLWERLRLPWGPGVGVLATVGWAGLVAAFDLNQAAKLAALAGVITFPTLAVLTVVRERGAGVGESLLRFVQAAAISLIGAAFLVGLLSDTGFMLKLDQFAGVKLAHTIPLLLVAGYLAFRPRGGAGTAGEWLAGIRGFLDQPVRVKYAAVAAVAAAAAVVYLLRTGNEPAMLVSSLEMQLRTFLDQVLAVRPRTKEFLLGHPWLLLVLFTGYRDARYLPLVVLGVIGQVSLVNTFAHLHTPLTVSLLRVGNGLWLGAAIGLFLIAAWYLAESRWPPAEERGRPVARGGTGE